jgi:hypothetical protein
VRVFGRQIIHKKRDSVNEKLTISDLWLMFDLGGFDPRNINSEMMGKLRAIATIEPIQGNTVFVADPVGRVDG